MCTYRRACPYSAYEYFMELLKISMYLREFQRGLLHRHLHHPLLLLVRMLGKIKISGLLLILAFSLSYKLKKHPAFPPTPRQGLVVEVEFPSSSASSCLSLQNGRKNIFFSCIYLPCVYLLYWGHWPNFLCMPHCHVWDVEVRLQLGVLFLRLFPPCCLRQWDLGLADEAKLFGQWASLVMGLQVNITVLAFLSSLFSFWDGISLWVPSWPETLCRPV